VGQRAGDVTGELGDVAEIALCLRADQWQTRALGLGDAADHVPLGRRRFPEQDVGETAVHQGVGEQQRVAGRGSLRLLEQRDRHVEQAKGLGRVALS
jgi:hypothetical protein